MFDLFFTTQSLIYTSCMYPRWNGTVLKQRSMKVKTTGRKARTSYLFHEPYSGKQSTNLKPHPSEANCHRVTWIVFMWMDVPKRMCLLQSFQETVLGSRGMTGLALYHWSSRNCTPKTGWGFETCTRTASCSCQIAQACTCNSPLIGSTRTLLDNTCWPDASFTAHPTRI